MSEIFSKTASYYDMLYGEKDYEGESSFIIKILQDNKIKSNIEILELGCGTGIHAREFSKNGYPVLGIDLSSNMISLAKKNNKNKKNSALTNFEVGDIRSYENSKKFDVVTCLFHVIGYITEESQLSKTFSNISNLVEKDGIFIFDYWYGPCVVNQKPSARIKRFNDNKLEVYRMCEPYMDEEKHIVEVRYKYFYKNCEDVNYCSYDEKHTIRYFYNNELERLLDSNGFKIVENVEWISRKVLGIDTWSAVCIARKL